MFKIISRVWMAAFLMTAVFGFATYARAAAPVLSLATNSDGSVQITVNGDANASIIMYYMKTNYGLQVAALGNTNPSGYFSTSVSSSSYDVATGSTVYVTTGGLSGARSADTAWPSSATTGNFSLSQTGLVLALGQTSAITANNTGSAYIYVSNNSNPPVANINVSGNQVSVTAISYGSTTATLCLQSNTSACASVYITVQNSSTQPLSFSISNVTITPAQSVPITISGGTGTYSVLNNSNSSVIHTNLSGNIVTLSTQVTSGISAITICSSDMSSCGIINATASTASSAPLVFSQTGPVLSVGQSLSIGLSGGSANTYYISSNSSTSTVSSTLSGSTLLLTGLAAGSSTITVCSTSGSCGALSATVSFTSTGGLLQLSQTSLSLLVGQVLAVTVSGGTSPYTLSANSGTIFQSSLNGNIVTVSGIATGSSVLNICSAGGACLPLTITVNSAGASTPIAFSQSTVSVGAGGATAVTITGNGGYYVSNSSNSAVASVQVNGSVAIITGLAAGNANVSVCQSGGQCAILFVTVSPVVSGNSLPSFSQQSPSVSVGQVTTVTVSGGSGGNYYIAANSNPVAASFSVSGSSITATGLAVGSATAVICSSATSCSPLTLTVGVAPAGTTVAFNPASVSLAVGATQTVMVSGGGTYYINSNTNPSVASAQLSGSSVMLTGLAAGNAVVSVCQSTSQCSPLNVAVTGAVIQPTPSATTNSLPSGTLVKDKGTIYFIANKTKIPFASLKAFTGLGFALSSVVTADISGYILGTTVLKSATQAHPNGSWIVSGKVVFYVAENGYIPVPTWDVFLHNGGQAKFIVKANAADLKDPRPIVSKMVNNDSRVIQ